MATIVTVMGTVTVMDTKKSNDMEWSLTDLHTHILPGVDDGAENLEVARKMLRMEKESGVERVALTCHFYTMHEEVGDFLKRRQRAFDALLSAWNAETMPQLQLGTEVQYSPVLAQVELQQLTIGNSEYLLLELPCYDVPAGVEQMVTRMQMQGVTPILAHVERCAYFRQEPERLLRLVRMGALAQVSVGALKDRKDHGFTRMCLQKGLAHIIASDAHNLASRSPCLGREAAFLDRELVDWVESFARAVWDNKQPPNFSIQPIKKGLCGFQ